MYSIEIETNNLILRDLRVIDLKGMYEMDSNPLVHKYLGNKPLKNVEETKKQIKSIQLQYEKYNIGRWAVLLKSTNEFIGWSGLKFNTDITYNNHNRFYDIGYRFIPKYWGNGYATESASVALHFGSKELNIDTIYEIAECENIASNKVLKNKGLQFKNQFLIKEIPANWYKLNNKDYATTMPRMW